MMMFAIRILFLSFLLLFVMILPKKLGELMDFKETLLLPTTSFAMRGDLAKNEPTKYNAWYSDNNCFDRQLQLTNLINHPAVVAWW